MRQMTEREKRSGKAGWVKRLAATSGVEKFLTEAGAEWFIANSDAAGLCRARCTATVPGGLAANAKKNEADRHNLRIGLNLRI